MWLVRILLPQLSPDTLFPFVGSVSLSSSATPAQIHPTLHHTTSHTRHTTTMSSDNEDFLAFGHDLIEQRIPKLSATTLIDLDGLLPVPLKLHEDLKNGCGGMLWAGGLVLAKYMLRNHKDRLRDKTMFVRWV
jgi:hypothetical protein